MSEPLSLDQVRHVAKLARLELSAAQLDAYREQLGTVLEHIDTLERLDVEAVEPLSHPLDLTNRLADDEVGPTLPIETLRVLAPAVEDRYLAVPKVLGEG